MPPPMSAPSSGPPASAPITPPSAAPTRPNPIPPRTARSTLDDVDVTAGSSSQVVDSAQWPTVAIGPAGAMPQPGIVPSGSGDESMPMQQDRARVPAYVLLLGPGKTTYSAGLLYAAWASAMHRSTSTTPGLGMHSTQFGFFPHGSPPCADAWAAVGCPGRP